MTTQDMMLLKFRARQQLMTAGHIASATVEHANSSPMSSQEMNTLQAIVGAKPLMHIEETMHHLDRILHLANSVTVSSYKWVKNINFVL